MSSIFKTGTFGFSTVLSTPCDYSSEGTSFHPRFTKNYHRYLKLLQALQFESHK